MKILTVSGLYLLVLVTSMQLTGDPLGVSIMTIFDVFS